MVRLGIRALISRISRRPSTPLNSTMVYSYSAPFESGKLKVSDLHSLQSVSSLFLQSACLTWEGTATRSREIETEPQVRFMAGQPQLPRIPVPSLFGPLAYRDDGCRPVVFLHGEGLVHSSVPSNAKPFLHGGGPGGGCDEKDRSFFNPNKYKVWRTCLSFSNDDESFCRSSSWTREALESLLRAWTKRSSFFFQHALSDVGIGVRAWKKTRLGIW